MLNLFFLNWTCQIDIITVVSIVHFYCAGSSVRISITEDNRDNLAVYGEYNDFSEYAQFSLMNKIAIYTGNTQD